MLNRAAFALALGLTLAACQKAPPAGEASPAPGAEAKSSIPELSVTDVATLVQSKAATVVDANDNDTRKEQGIVPGAVLLSSREYAVSELPAAKDTKLVFYCGGTACRSSDKAAQRASEAGYADVAVMRAGIRGWKSAGQQTATPQS